MDPNFPAPGGAADRMEGRLFPEFKDALSYVHRVESEFQNKPQVFRDFLQILNDFKSQRIDMPGVIQRVSNLFRHHPALLEGFNSFLPRGDRIQYLMSTSYKNFVDMKEGWGF